MGTNVTVGETEAAFRDTRRVYDLVAPLYPLSSLLFHSRAHRAALSASGIRNGTRVLEIGTGSGEMLKRLVRVNPDGHTIGVDLSPKMAARSQTNARRRFPQAQIHCQAADVRYLPFASASFDAVMCCYLFELLPEAELDESVAEVSRVLRPGGRLTTILVGQNKSSFNALYAMGSRVAPAFWGRQVGKQVAGLLHAHRYSIDKDHHVRQVHYSSRIISAVRAHALATSSYHRAARRRV
ncbi:MAG: class I SAM-dependent methyltransferase [Acidobacteriaceae bacterium]|nr:class I SAM-dependent methyltransferase [Acidobacteriaceae bacterium]